MIRKTLKKQLVFLSLFTALGYIALQIPFTKLVGSNVSFTLFDFLGPIAGAFLGPWLGIASVLAVQITNIAAHQTPLSTGAIIRLFPTLFAVYYFAVLAKKNGKKELPILVVPFLAILVFLAHPIGRTVWYFSLFWFIPPLAYLKKEHLLARSLGATFTAHAVGGAAWIWAFNLPASVWQKLIPIVIAERVVFALGISASYLILKRVLSFVIAKKLLPRLDSLAHSV